jgi:GntR family transcriptional regulator
MNERSGPASVIQVLQQTMQLSPDRRYFLAQACVSLYLSCTLVKPVRHCRVPLLVAAHYILKVPHVIRYRTSARALPSCRPVTSTGHRQSLGTMWDAKCRIINWVEGMTVSVLQGNEDLPSYRRLALSLAEEIDAGRYGSQTPLPTDTELMLRYGLGRQTVRRAFQELVADGLVYRVRGKGTFPTTRPKSGRTVRSTGSVEALEQWTGTEMEVISGLELRRDLEYAQRLELDGPVVARLTVRRWIDDEPFAVTDVHLPPDVGNQLVWEDKIPHGRVTGTILAFVGAIAGPVVSAEETVTAIAVPAPLAEVLHTAPDRPALRVERLYRDSDGHPVEISTTVHASERYQHRLTIHRAGTHGRSSPTNA